MSTDGAKLLDEVSDFNREFIAYTRPEDADAIAAWEAHSHARDDEGALVFKTTPRLFVGSDTSQSGKTTQVKIVRDVSAAGYKTSRITGPDFAREVAQNHPTLILDEFDRNPALTSYTAGGNTLFGAINDGCEWDGQITVGGNRMSIFCPLAIAGKQQKFIGNPNLEPTRSRCIFVKLNRPEDAATLASIREYDEDYDRDDAHALRDALGSWIGSHRDELRYMRPVPPRGVVMRKARIWRPLLAIAQLAGGDWPDRIVAACNGDGAQVPLSPRQKLAEAIAEAWPDDEVAIHTSTLLDRLRAAHGYADRWPTDAAACRAIAAALAPLEPGSVRIENKVAQGYRRSRALRSA